MAVGNPITELSTTGNFVPVTRTLTINGVSYDLSADRSWSVASPGGGSVTSVAMTVPTGFSVTGSPITTAGTLAVTFAAGYALPTTVKQSNWDDAYTFVSNFPSQTGNNGKFLYTSGSVLSWQPALQNPMTAVGDMIYGGVSGAVTVLPGNQFTTRAYLQQVGTGSASSAPTWGGIISTDIVGQALTKTDDTNVTVTLGGTPGNSVLNAVSLTLGWAGQLSAGRGGTGTSGVTGIMLGNATAPVTGITGIGGQILRVNPSTSAYEFFTAPFLESPFTALGQIIYSGAGAQPLALNANTTGNNMYLRSVSSGVPGWATISGSDIIGAALTRTNDTNVQITLGGTPTTALLRSVSLTMGWTGQLSVPRGGTGANSLTGVVIGNSTGAMTAVAGSAEQLLRRNAANSAYEFFTPTFLTNPMTSLGDMITGNAAGAPLRLPGNTTTTRKYLSQIGDGTNVLTTSWETVTGGVSGSGTTNFVPIWTSSTALGNSSLSITGGEANFGSNKLVAGSASATSGSIMLQDNYSLGHLGNIGTMYSGGNLMLGYGVQPSLISATGFLSATSIAIPRSAITLGGAITFYNAASQTISIGSSITMIENMSLKNTGQFKLNSYTSSTSFAGTAAGYLAFTSVGDIITVAAPSGTAGQYRIDFNSTTPETWSNQPSTLQFFDSQASFITAADLTNFTQVRFLINKLGTAANTGAKMYLRYSTTYSQTASSYSDIGTSSVELAIDTSNQFLETSWINLASGAKADVFVTILGDGGDGVLDPIFGMITAEFK